MSDAAREEARDDDKNDADRARLNPREHVDEAEERIEQERKEEGVPGNVEDRESTEPVEPDDQAPE